MRAHIVVRYFPVICNDYQTLWSSATYNMFFNASKNDRAWLLIATLIALTVGGGNIALFGCLRREICVHAPHTFDPGFSCPTDERLG